MSAVNSIFNFLRFNKKNWKAVVLSLSAATVFWFFNALNKTYTTILSFPVEFQYDQDNFVPVSDLPTEVKMNVTGLGWSLLRRSANVKVPPLQFPLERPTEVKKIVGSTLPVLFSNQLSDLQINFVTNDTLWLDIEPYDGRWLTLTLGNISNNFRSGFGLSSNATITPDSAFVQGPRRIVEALLEPYPFILPIKNIDENIETTVDIPFSYNRLDVEPKQVNISFTVEKLMDIEDSVKVEFTNIPERTKIAISINYIHYSLRIPESYLRSNYSRETIKAKLDLKGLKNGKSKLAPIISGIPPFTQIIEIDSIEVSY